MQNERVKDYFVEDIQKELEEERWQLVIQARYGDGLLIETSTCKFCERKFHNVFRSQCNKEEKWAKSLEMYTVF